MYMYESNGYGLLERLMEMVIMHIDSKDLSKQHQDSRRGEKERTTEVSLQVSAELKLSTMVRRNYT